MDRRHSECSSCGSFRDCSSHSDSSDNNGVYSLEKEVNIFWNHFSGTPGREICYLTQVILPRAHVLGLNIGCIERHGISSFNDVTKRQNTSVLFKMADVNAGYLKVKQDLSKHWH